MRNGQNNNNKRMRNNNRGGGGSGGNNNNGGNNNRRGQNPMTRVFESNGPDIKIRGTASHIAEKYVQLARDARSSGDPVAAENYYQHAEHYFRLIAAAQEQFRQSQPQPRLDNGDGQGVDIEDDSETYSNFGAEPGFVTSQQQQPQPFVQREQPQPREGQPFQPREQQQPREAREPREQREPRAPREPREPRQYQPQPQPQVQPAQASLPIGDNVGLPSFITGPQPQVSVPTAITPDGGERFTPRRRRRPHTPRTESAESTTDSAPENVSSDNS